MKLLPALDEELKSIRPLAAATNIASVPVPSSGAWKKIDRPNTSSCAISVSPDCRVIVGDEPSMSSYLSIRDLPDCRTQYH